jgi:hypothetical protein
MTKEYEWRRSVRIQQMQRSWDPAAIRRFLKALDAVVPIERVDSRTHKQAQSRTKR